MDTSYNAVVADNTLAYTDQVNRFAILNSTIKGLFESVGLGNALDVAEACHVRDSTLISLRWRPVYPYTKDDAEYDADVALDFENDYCVEVNITCNGMGGDYRLRFGWKVQLQKVIGLEEAGPIPASQVAKKATMPDNWKQELKKIMADMQSAGNRTAKRAGFFRKLIGV